MGLIKNLLSEEPGLIEKTAFLIKNKGNTGAYGEYLTKYLFSSVRINGYHKETYQKKTKEQHIEDIKNKRKS